MAFVLETGTGTAGSNAYVSVQEARSHHEDRGNEFFESILVAATGDLAGTLNVSNAETVTVGAKTYTFQNTLTNVDGNVFVGANLTGTFVNLVAAINRSGSPGVQYAASMTLNPNVSAASVATKLTVTAKVKGEAANTLALATTSVTVSWGASTLTGGDESKVRQVIIRATDYIDKRFGPRFIGERQQIGQGLAWPRLGAFDSDGYYLNGIPAKLKAATAEYALRAALYNVLAPDPTRLAPGQNLSAATVATTAAGASGAVTKKREKVGPLEVEETYESIAKLVAENASAGSRNVQSNVVQDFSIPEYPEADLWIEELLMKQSGSTRIGRA